MGVSAWSLLCPVEKHCMFKISLKCGRLAHGCIHWNMESISNNYFCARSFDFEALGCSKYYQSTQSFDWAPHMITKCVFFMNSKRKSLWNWAVYRPQEVKSVFPVLISNEFSSSLWKFFNYLSFPSNSKLTLGNLIWKLLISPPFSQRWNYRSYFYLLSPSNDFSLIPVSSFSYKV